MNKRLKIRNEEEGIIETKTKKKKINKEERKKKWNNMRLRIRNEKKI